MNRTVLKMLSVGTLLALASTVSCTTAVDDEVAREGEELGETSTGIDDLVAPGEEPGDGGSSPGRDLTERTMPTADFPDCDDSEDCCPDGYEAIEGTAGNDNLDGPFMTASCLVGLAGNDSLDGSAHADNVLLGGPDGDDINGGFYRDVVLGGDGADDIRTIHGPDEIDAGAGGDFVDSGFDDDVVFGGEGDDTIRSSSGLNWIDAGPGDDDVTGGFDVDTVFGGEGMDVIDGGDDPDWISGGPGGDTLEGGFGDDYIEGNAGGDLIEGGTGGDTIIGGPGRDEVYGQIGNDTVVIYDVCELEAGEILDGGFAGYDTLVTPIEVADLEAVGVIVDGFEQIEVAADPWASQCTACGCHNVDHQIVCCSGVGTCTEDDDGGTGNLRCECSSGWVGNDCSAPSEHGYPADTPPDCAPDDPGCKSAVPEGYAFNVSFDPSPLCDDIPDLADVDEMNAMIYRPGPEGDFPAGPFPLAVFAHGNGHDYTRYDELFEQISVNNVVVASVQGPGVTTPFVRGQYLLCWARFLNNDINDNGWEFSGRLDGHTAFAGHSTGGEGAGWAARFHSQSNNSLDDNYSRDAVVSLAPTADSFAMNASDVGAFMALQSSFDEDAVAKVITLTDVAGEDEAGFSDPKLLKTVVWFYRASHSAYGGKQSCLDVPDTPVPCTTDADCTFEKIQGECDLLVSDTCVFECDTTLKGVTLGRAYIGGFLYWRLRGEDDQRRLFADNLIPDSVANGDFWTEFGDEPMVFTQYREGLTVASNRLIVDGFEDGELSVSTVGGAVTPSGAISYLVDSANTLNAPYTRKNRGKALRASWTGTDARLLFEIPGGVSQNADASTNLSFRVAHAFHRSGQSGCETANDPDLAFSVALGSNGEFRDVSTTQFGGLPVQDHGPALAGNPQAQWHDMECHAADFMRTIRIPLSAFCDQGLLIPGIDAVELRFDQSQAGEVLIDSLEFTTSYLDDPGDGCGYCGNGVAEAGEECDLNDVDEPTCEDHNKPGGDAVVFCNPDCTYNFGNCIESTCAVGLPGDPDCPCLKVGTTQTGGTLPCSDQGAGYDGCYPDGPGSYGITGLHSNLDNVPGDYCLGDDVVCTLHNVGGVSEPICSKPCPDPGEGTNEGAYGCPCLNDNDCVDTGRTGAIAGDNHGTNVEIRCWGSPDTDGWLGGYGTCLPAVDAVFPRSSSITAREEFERTRWLCKANCEALTLGANGETHICQFNQDADIKLVYASCVENICDNAPGLACADMGGHCGSEVEPFDGCISACEYPGGVPASCGECNPADNYTGPGDTGNPACIAHGYPGHYLCSVLVQPHRCVPAECAILPGAPDISECDQFLYGNP